MSLCVCREMQTGMRCSWGSGDGGTDWAWGQGRQGFAPIVSGAVQRQSRALLAPGNGTVGG